MKLLASEFQVQQQLLKLVPNGFPYFLTGECKTVERLEELASKFEEHYGTNLSAPQRAYRKTKGLGNCHAYSAWCEGDGVFRWFLIASEGANPIFDAHSKLGDARKSDSRITWGKEYVMFPVTRPKQHGGGQHWTWFIQRETQREIDLLVGKSLKQGPWQLPLFLETLLHRPMHSGIRSQINRVIHRAHKSFCQMHPTLEWKGPTPEKKLPVVAGFHKTELLDKEVAEQKKKPALRRQSLKSKIEAGAAQRKARAEAQAKQAKPSKAQQAIPRRG